MECIHVAATKFFPLLQRKGFGMVFLMDARQIAATILTVFTAETRQTTRSIDHQDFSRRVAAIALEFGLRRASRQIEQAVESFVGLDCRDLMSC